MPLNLPKELQPYEQLILQLSQKYDLDPALWAGLLMYESGGNPTVVNQIGAVGLGQVMSREAGFKDRPTIKELQDPATNLEWSARILADGTRRYGKINALAAYLGAIDPKTGQPTNASDANGTTGPAYIRSVLANAQRYGFTPGLPATGSSQQVGNTMDPLRIEKSRQLVEASQEVTTAQLRLQAAQRLVASMPAPRTGAVQLQADVDARKNAEKELDEAQAAVSRATARVNTLRTDIAEIDSKSQSSGGGADDAVKLRTAEVNLQRSEHELMVAQNKFNQQNDPNSPEYKRAQAELAQAQQAVVASQAAVARQNALLPGELQGQSLSNQKAAQSIAESGALLPGQLETQRLGNARTQQAIDQADALHPGAVQAQNLSNSRIQQQLDQEEKRFPLELEQLGIQLGLNQAQLEQFKQLMPLTLKKAGIDLDAAEFNTSRAKALLPGELALQGAQLDRVQRLEDPLAEYTRQAQIKQVLARQERDRLLALQKDGTITAQQAEEQFTSFFQSQVEQPLAAYKQMAERQRAIDQMNIDQQQRAENARVEALNRERENTALSAGTRLRDQAAQLVPNVRSNAFLGQVANVANSWMAGGRPAPPAFDPASFRPDPGQVPDMSAIAQQEAARVLASISPAAAAQVGRPLPQIPDLPTLQSMIPRFSMP